MFFEKFQTVYEGASVVYSIEAVLNIEEDNEAFHSPVAKEIIEVARRVPERVDTEYYKSHKIVKVCLLFSSNGNYASIPALSALCVEDMQLNGMIAMIVTLYWCDRHDCKRKLWSLLHGMLNFIH